MHDLATRIRDHYESAADPVTVDEIFAGARPETAFRQAHEKPTSAPAVSRRQRVIAVAVATASLVLVGGTAWILRSTETDRPVAPTAVLTADPFTPTIDPLTSFSWSRVPHDEAAFGGVAREGMSSVTVGGPGLVAVGSSRWNGPAVWTSSDGVNWSRVPPDGPPGIGRHQLMSSVVAGGPGLVAVGIDESANDGDAAVWTSPDGLTWSRVPHDEAVFGGSGRQFMLSVVVGGPGLVAVGGDHATGPAVWTSPDGVTWSRVPPDDDVFSGRRDQWMTDIAVGGPGLVAVGEGDGVSTRPAVWTSPDGISWTWIPHNEAFEGGDKGYPGMSSVAAGGPGLVAVGSIDHHAAVWTSVDGVIWSRVPHNDAVFGEEGSGMESVTVGGPGLVAVGGEIDGEANVAVWTSIDGITWSRVPHDNTVFSVSPDVGTNTYGQAMESVTASPYGLIAVGFDVSGGNRTLAAVWVGLPED